jgi:hypothetical protein
MIRRVGRFASGGCGRRLRGQAFAAGRFETGPFRVILFFVERLTFHQCCGQIQSSYVGFVIIPLILIHIVRPRLACAVAANKITNEQ